MTGDKEYNLSSSTVLGKYEKCCCWEAGWRAIFFLVDAFFVLASSSTVHHKPRFLATVSQSWSQSCTEEARRVRTSGLFPTSEAARVLAYVSHTLVDH